MAQTHEHGGVLPQETNFDNADQPGISQPYTQSEIEDLVFNGTLSVQERLARLREMRDEAATRESGDWGDGDPAVMMDEIDRAIEELSGDQSASDDNLPLEPGLSDDPSDHLHVLSPDDVDAQQALTGEDEFYDEEEDGPIDDDQWAGSEEFRH
ncbi:hypothetical protein [Devosia sp. FJ2-5-3]|uniref:hypothetical protein n=1 Tax=Devosia sp. FJ2-5-3 TaxID=2976680 RepID=UPI0023D81D5C|nr:hypothetical protein [Devosia sp. FJ2-5-3]WEJ56980.1 hypothetical protein N0P34_12260 [Devosia sp. FJ2-5-3]